MTQPTETPHKDLQLLLTDHGMVFGVAAGSADGLFALGIHGFSQRNNSSVWQGLLDPLALAGYRFCSVDMPGWGMSDPWLDERGEVVQHGRGTILTLLDTLGAEQAVLVGKSWGGGLALETALHHPERVTALLLTAPAYAGDLADLTRLTQPVLLAWAKDDPVIPVTRAEQLVQAIPHAELIIYETGGHSAAQKNMDDFAARAVAFLSNSKK